MRRYARLVSLDAMIRKPSDAIAAAEGCRARNSPEAVGAPPSSSPASNAGPVSRRLQRVAGEAPKVVRRIIFSRRSMRKKDRRLSGMRPPRGGTGCEMSEAPRCGATVRSAATCRYVGFSLMVTSSAPVRPGRGSTPTENVVAEGWRCMACRWMTTNAWPESRAIDVPSAAGRRPAWTPMAPLLSTTGPGRFVGCCAACATRGQWDSVRSVRVVVRCRDQVGLAPMSTTRGGHAA